MYRFSTLCCFAVIISSTLLLSTTDVDALNCLTCNGNEPCSGTNTTCVSGPPVCGTADLTLNGKRSFFRTCGFPPGAPQNMGAGCVQVQDIQFGLGTVCLCTSDDCNAALPSSAVASTILVAFALLTLMAIGKFV